MGKQVFSTSSKNNFLEDQYFIVQILKHTYYFCKIVLVPFLYADWKQYHIQNKLVGWLNFFALNRVHLLFLFTSIKHVYIKMSDTNVFALMCLSNTLEISTCICQS